MSSSFNLNSSCNYCKSVFKNIEELVTHEEQCPIMKMIWIEQTEKGMKSCLFCKQEEVDNSHECKERVLKLITHLLTKKCSEWLKAYIMTAIVSYKPGDVTADGDSEDYSDLIQAIITASEPND